MIALAPIVARVAAQCPLLVSVAGASEFAAVSERVTIHPAAWVLPEQDSAGDNRYGAGAISQRVATAFSVVIVAGTRGDQLGGATHDVLRPLRLQVLEALLGWHPTDAAEPITYLSGELLQVSAGLVWWRDTYTSAWEARATSGTPA